MWRLGNYELAEHTVSRPGPLTRRLRKRGRARVSEPPTDSSPRSSAGKQSGCRTSRNAGGSATGARLQAVQSGKWKMRPGARLAVASPRLRHAPGCIPEVGSSGGLDSSDRRLRAFALPLCEPRNQQETGFAGGPFGEHGGWRLRDRGQASPPRGTRTVGRRGSQRECRREVGGFRSRPEYFRCSGASFARRCPSSVALMSTAYASESEGASATMRVTGVSVRVCAGSTATGD
jgi:hypothetical protein